MQLHTLFEYFIMSKFTIKKELIYKKTDSFEWLGKVTHYVSIKLSDKWRVTSCFHSLREFDKANPSNATC